jgi:catalase
MMSNSDVSSKNIAENRYSFPAFLHRASPLGLGVIAMTVATLAGSFAWAAGWLSPGRLDQGRIINTFERVNGVHPGFRRNHAKGICLAGFFEGNGAGERYSKAVAFRPGRVPVFGRFALAGGVPTVTDGPSAVRSMALNFTLPDGEIWRTGMNDIPVFPVKDARGFYEQLVAMKPDPKTGKPNPEQVQAFLGAHPETARAMALIRAKPHSSGFANETYNSLNAFRLVNADGSSTNVRWSMIPVDASATESAGSPDDKNYLFDDLIARIERGAVQWHLVLTIGLPEDPANDATLPWPENREHVDVGTLTVTGLETERAGNCRDANFDPLLLPAGIAASDDPLLSARSAAYSVSFTRRSGEEKSPSAVQTRKGS